MAYQAEIRMLEADGTSAMNPSSIRVLHHRTAQAELKVDRLSGGHMLHLALAACVFGNLLRLAQEQGIGLADARVVAEGGFNEDATQSIGITCQLDVTGEASPEALIHLGQEAFADSSIATILRRTTTVELSEVRVRSTS